jgi:hypothetical protein
MNVCSQKSTGHTAVNFFRNTHLHWDYILTKKITGELHCDPCWFVMEWWPIDNKDSVYIYILCWQMLRLFKFNYVAYQKQQNWEWGNVGQRRHLAMGWKKSSMNTEWDITIGLSLWIKVFLRSWQYAHLNKKSCLTFHYMLVPSQQGAVSTPPISTTFTSTLHYASTAEVKKE